MDKQIYHYGDCHELAVPVQAIEDCSHSGDCFDDCAKWVDSGEIEFNIEPVELDKHLSEYGAWPECPAGMMDEHIHRENCIKLLWIAAGDLQEQMYEQQREAEIS